MDRRKKVILIQGEGSQWYEQAIFIVGEKAGGAAVPKDFVREAESIVQNYLLTGEKQPLETVYGQGAKQNDQVRPEAKPKRRWRTADFLLNIAAVFLCIILALIIDNVFFFR